MNWADLMLACNVLYMSGLHKAIAMWFWRDAAGVAGRSVLDLTAPEAEEDSQRSNTSKVYLYTTCNQDRSSACAQALVLEALREIDPTFPDPKQEYLPTYTPLLEVLDTNRRRVSSDPRDKVYALIGLASRSCHEVAKPHESRRPLKANYHKCTSEAYLDVAWYILLSDSDLALLSRCEVSTGQEGLKNASSIEGLPSWVPDWSVLLVNDMLAASRGKAGDWAAAGSLPWVPPPEPLLHGPTLCVQGSRVGTICTAAEGKFTFSEAIRVAMSLQTGYPATSPGQSPFEVLRRTVVADVLDDKKPAPQEGALAFQAFYTESMPRSTAAQWALGHRTISLGDADIASANLGCSEVSLGFDMYLASETDMDAFWKSESVESNLKEYWRRFQGVSASRRLFSTRDGLLENGPSTLSCGDEVWILAGAKVPFVLRAQQTHYQVIGETYLHGMMHGEALQQPGFALCRIMLC